MIYGPQYRGLPRPRHLRHGLHRLANAAGETRLSHWMFMVVEREGAVGFVGVERRA